MSRPITDTLHAIGHGAFMDQISAAMNAATCATRDTGKGSTLTIKVTVKPTGRGGAMTVSGEHTLKLPKAPAEDALMWPDESGDLLTSDPRQSKLDLRTVDTDTGEIRVVNSN